MLKKAKLKLILEHPFFASTALKMNYVEDKSVGTISISRRQIKYNPDFIAKMNTENTVALLAHEVLHYNLLHHIRAKGKDPNDWNKACDYAINPILLNSKFKLPEGYLYKPDFVGKSADEIYRIIRQDKEPDNQNEQGDDQSQDQSQDNSAPQNWGKVEPPQDDEIAEAEAEAKQDAMEAINIGKQSGKLPSAIERIIEEVIEPKKDWRELLLKFIAEIAKNDYDWSSPNKRYLVSGLYLPHLKSLELGKVVFAIDTSASIDNKLLSSFVAEIKEASNLFNFPVTVIHCDSKIQKVEELDYDSEIKPVGGGGTKFNPVFNYIDENLPDTKALVYFTDGDCSDNPKEPEYEVLWVIYDNPNFKMDFGEIIYIKS